MDNLDRFCKGYLIEGTQKTPISLQMSLTSDIEKNPPRNIFKKMSIKDNDKDYHIPDAVDGFNVIGFEDQFARGWSHHGYYYIGNNVVFIPFSFLGISNDNKYEGKYIPKISAYGKWRIDFYKKVVISERPRVVRYIVKGGNWTYTSDSKTIQLYDFSLLDMKARECISVFAGVGYNINKFSTWTKEVLQELEGWRPCLVRNDKKSFIIEYRSYDTVYY